MKKLWFYRNLRTGNFSMKKGSNGRVSPIAFATLSGVKCHVRENGRQKVIREKRKNVHAFLIASSINVTIANDESVKRILGENVEDNYKDWEEVTYNPYRGGYFYWKSDGTPVKYLPYATLINGKVYSQRSK